MEKEMNNKKENQEEKVDNIIALIEQTNKLLASLSQLNPDSKQTEKLEADMCRGTAQGYVVLSALEKRFGKHHTVCVERERKDIVGFNTELMCLQDFYPNGETMVFPSSDIIVLDTANIEEETSEEMKQTVVFGAVADHLNKIEKAAICGYVKAEECEKEFMKKNPHLQLRDWIVPDTALDAMKFLDTLDMDRPIYIIDVKNDVYAEMRLEAEKVRDEYMGRFEKGIKMSGDIIITDPCYFVKKRDTSTAPKWDDFFIAKSIREYPDYNEETDESKLFREHSNKMDKAVREWDAKNPDDWDDFKGAMKRAGISNYLLSRTMRGDGSWDIVDADDKKLGSFCVDSGEFAVFLLSDVLKYNPEYNYDEEKPWTATVIKGFEGTVKIRVNEYGFKIVGEGNINFSSKDPVDEDEGDEEECEDEDE